MGLQHLAGSTAYSNEHRLIRAMQSFGVHDRLHIYPPVSLRVIFYFLWHRHQIEGTDGV